MVLKQRFDGWQINPIALPIQQIQEFLRAAVRMSDELKQNDDAKSILG